MMGRLDIFGPLGISVQNRFEPIDDGSPFAHLILVALADSSRALTTAELARRLWSDHDDEAGESRKNLISRYVGEARKLLDEDAQAIRTLRHGSAGTSYILDRPDASVGDVVKATLHTDVYEYRQHRRRNDDEGRRAALALVRGDPLPGIDSTLNGWLAECRDEYRTEHIRLTKYLTDWSDEHAQEIVHRFLGNPEGTLLDAIDQELASTPVKRETSREAHRQPHVDEVPARPSHLRWSRHRFVRVSAVGCALLAASLTAFLWKPWTNAHASRVQLELTSDQGAATVKLASGVANAMSPGCGCEDPRFGRHPWFGLSVPAHGFTLVGTMSPSRQVDGKTWQITALSPALDQVDWYTGATNSISMSVILSRDGRQRWSYHGRVRYVDLVTDTPVRVEHGASYPYAAVIPASGGSTRVISHQGPSAQLGGTLDITTTTPARPFRPDAGNELANTVDMQHGPMIDLLGWTITLRTQVDRQTQLYAGMSPFFGLDMRRGELLTITIRTPFALRLIPHPASKSLVNRPEPTKFLDKEEYEHIRAHQSPRLTELLEDPTSRRVDDTATSAYQVELANVAVPGAAAWQRFSQQSTEGNGIPAMLAPDHDDLASGDPRSEYYLPPVPETPEIGVFGPITRFTSTAVRGEVSTNEGTRPIILGQRLVVRSHRGLDAGKYRMTPLISAGLPTEPSVLAGDATVAIDEGRHK